MTDTKASELLGPEEVAELLALNRRLAYRVMQRADFPPPVIDLSRKTRRWARSSVVTWIERSAKRGARGLA